MKAINPSANPLVLELFRLMEEAGYPACRLAEKAGVSNVTLHYWKEGRMGPQLFTFQSVLHALGYRLKIEPIEGYVLKQPDRRRPGRRSYFSHWSRRN